MNMANEAFLAVLELEAQARRADIRAAKDEMNVSRQRYYVSNAGDDAADGRTPESAWQTLARANEEALQPGDALLLRRGDLFRGQIRARSGVSYGAYGAGEKPRIYAGECDLADPDLWMLHDAEHHIWKSAMPLLDAGTLVFNGGEAHSRKLIPSYLGGKFVCRNAPEKDFVLAEEMTQDLDLFCWYDGHLTRKPSRGQDFPIPDMDDDCLGHMYLRCDRGNPGEVFDSIESVARRHLVVVGENHDVRIDNLCLMYTGQHAIAAGGVCVKNLCVSNCEIGWIGGSVQHYMGTDPNYPQGGRGTVTRYGNGVEIYGGCDGYEVYNCYIYQVYDAGITHQGTCFQWVYRMANIRYHHNLVEHCVYGIEYFLETAPDNESIMTGVEMDHNIIRFSGYGWGQQRHNVDTPAHIKGWSYVNTAENFRIHDNLFDRAGYRMVHLVALKEDSLPVMADNTYVQYVGDMLGQYGANEAAEPPIVPFDERAEDVIVNQWKDEYAAVHGVRA